MRHQGITDIEAYAVARPLSPAILLALLAANADVEPTDLAKRRTALHLASSKGHHSYVVALLKAQSKNMDVNAKCKYASRATRSPYWSSPSDPLFFNRNGNTPLHSASRNGHLDIVQTLLSFKADVNARNKYVL